MAASQTTMHKSAASQVLILDGHSLSCESLVSAMQGGVNISLADSAWEKIRASRLVVEEIVKSGRPTYGITTGVGSQKDFSVAESEVEIYNRKLIAAHATRVPGPLMPHNSVRGILILMCNQYARGLSGVSEPLVRLLLKKINGDEFPDIDASGSVGASDLVPLAQIAHWLLSSPEAVEAKLPQAKEALSLINSNSATLVEGARAIIDVQRLMAAFDLSLATALEGFRGNLNSISEIVNAVHRRRGQHISAWCLRSLLSNSILWRDGEPRFIQDPLSFRCASQVHGAAFELLERAHTIWNEELNSLNDNPLIDSHTGTAHSNGNMDTTRFALAIDGLRQALAKVADIAGERLHKQQWNSFSDLPTGLVEEAGAVGGVQFLNLGHIGASLITSAKIWARPHLLMSVGQVADGVEDTAGHAFHSIHDLHRLIEASWKIVTIETIVSVWAIHRRRLSVENIGRAVRLIYKKLLPLLPIGTEGHEVFNLDILVQSFRGYELIDSIVIEKNSYDTMSDYSENADLSVVNG